MIKEGFWTKPEASWNHQMVRYAIVCLIHPDPKTRIGFAANFDSLLMVFP